MTIVDIEHEVFKCPHCLGYLIIREQYPYDGYGCSLSVEHSISLPEWLKKETRGAIEQVTTNDTPPED
jgi:hypothetical protein